jgi:acetyltransferase-like isoleucine patch superfamily enzyme
MFPTGKISRRIYEMLLEITDNKEKRINYLRKKGIKIGQDCEIRTMSFSTEPYLIEIGNRVRIASGTQFITHDGSIMCFRDDLKGGLFGKIKIGNNVFIGMNCIVLLNTTIGDNCIIGAGSVVRGHFAENSIIIGNPAKVVSNITIQKMFFRNNSGFLKTNNLSESEKDKIVKRHFGID